MSLPYNIHAGARLRRILRQKGIVILHYSKKAGLTPQGLYRYFSQATIKREKLEVLLDAVPITLEDFYHWDSLAANAWHQGELLLLYLAKQKIKTKQLTDRLHLSENDVQEWLDCSQFSEVQLRTLEHQLGLDPAYFTDPQLLKRHVNWEEAYLDKCMEAKYYKRKVNILEKKISILETR